MGVTGSAGGVVVAIVIGGGVDRLVGIGVGVVREARKGPSEAHPALKSNPKERMNRKIRDMLTN